MNDTPCADCGVETLPVDDRRAEWYVVVDEVWPRSARPSGRRAMDPTVIDRTRLVVEEMKWASG